MQTQKSIIIVLGLMILTAYCVATPENPNVGNPFTNRNTVPSTNQSRRMITQLNSYGSYGNQIVTGNVGGLKYFRGVVPYSSGYYSSAYSRDSGSASVSSFLRRSANPIVNDRNPSRIGSYFEPRRTVSNYGTRPDGSSGLSRPTIPSQGTSSYVIPGLPQLKNTQFSQRPLAGDTQELDALLAKQAKMKNKAQIKENKDKKEISKDLSLYDILTPEQIKELIAKQQPKMEVEGTEKLLPEENIFAEFMKEQNEALLEKNISQREDSTQSDESDSKAGDSKTEKAKDDEILNKVLSAEGRKVLGEHKTFNSLADNKLIMYLKAGEDFLKKGQYYKAADAYSLAAIWKPEDGRIYLGQTLALFAAGEYMSSSYYLNRAFELNKTLASVKYDIAAIVGDRDTYENRIVEVSDWQQHSGSGELAFLMAYIYHQDGKKERAVTAINTALKAMPDSKAVILLKNIITPDTSEK